MRGRKESLVHAVCACAKFPWRSDREYSSPVWSVATESCGTPHRVRFTNLDIILNMKPWKLRIESSTVAPIEIKKKINCSYHKFPQHTPDSNRIHTHLVPLARWQPPGLGVLNVYNMISSVLDPAVGLLV